MKKILMYKKIIVHLLKNIAKNMKLEYIFLVFSSIFMALLFVVRANIEKQLFDGTYLFFKDYSVINKNNLILNFILFIIVYISLTIIISSSNTIEELIEFKLQKQLSKGICNKTASLSAENFEDVRFLNKLEQAEKGKDDIINMFLSTTALVTYYIPYIILMSVWLWNQSKILVIIILLAFIPTILSYSFQIKMFADNEDKVAPYRRKEKAYEECIIGKDNIKETRVLGAFNFFIKKYSETLKIIKTNDLSVLNKQQRINLMMNLIQTMSFVSIIGIAIYLAASNIISIGAFAAVFTSIDILYSNLDEAVSRQYASISESFATVENYYNFIEDNSFKTNNLKTYQISKVENLGFKYPNSEDYTLKDINFSIKEGERIAIVGENGAGKSTLAKLLLGIYAPTNGVIYYNQNKNCKYTAVTQDYLKYFMTIKENVIVSDYEKEYKSEEINKLLYKCGLDTSKNNFANGIDTFLGREFGGMDLSGGQWQKLAIARGVYKDFDFIVFDEPTASIDPLEETNILNIIEDITKDKTSFIITHRMAAVKFVDRILVMKKGNIVENGSHHELMEVKGEYYRLYNSQKSNYYER